MTNTIHEENTKLQQLVEEYEKVAYSRFYCELHIDRAFKNGSDDEYFTFATIGKRFHFMQYRLQEEINHEVKHLDMAEMNALDYKACYKAREDFFAQYH